MEWATLPFPPQIIMSGTILRHHLHLIYDFRNHLRHYQPHPPIHHLQSFFMFWRHLPSFYTIDRLYPSRFNLIPTSNTLSIRNFFFWSIIWHIISWSHYHPRITYSLALASCSYLNVTFFFFWPVDSPENSSPDELNKVRIMLLVPRAFIHSYWIVCYLLSLPLFLVLLIDVFIRTDVYRMSFGWHNNDESDL